MSVSAQDRIAGDEPYLLKIYDGPHRGAELPLETGRRYAIGSGDEADIVLHDPLVSPVHAHLDIGEGVVTLLAVGGEVSLDGRPLAVEGEETVRPVDVAGGAIVGIGGTRLAIGRHGELPATLTVRAPTLGPGRTDEASSEAKGRSRSVRSGPGKTLYLAMAFVTFAAFVAIVFSQSPRTLEPRDGTLVAQVEDAVDGLPIQERGIIALPDGKVLLQGYVGSEDERRQVVERVERFERQVTLEVWSDQGLVDDANQVLASLDLAENVSAVSSERGTLVFSGYLDSRSTWETALSALRNDIVGIEGVSDDGVRTMIERVRRVRAALDESFPGADVSVAEAGGEILIRGTIADADAIGLRSLVERLGSEFDGRPALALQVARVKEQMVELDIRWVSVGENGYVLTGSGERYMQGGVLTNGYVIKAIRADRLILTRGGYDTDYLL